jgi:hypothetical protein
MIKRVINLFGLYVCTYIRCGRCSDLEAFIIKRLPLSSNLFESSINIRSASRMLSIIS